MEIKYYRKMKEVDRLNGKFKLRPYNLLEHSYMVVALFRHFASKEDVAYNMNTIDVIMHHDILEVETSDLPYTVKNHSPVTKKAWGDIEEDILRSHHQLNRYNDEAIHENLTEIQHRLFKVCDLLDLWIFLKEEQTYGNNSSEVAKVIGKCEELIKGKFVHVDKYMENYAW